MYSSVAIGAHIISAWDYPRLLVFWFCYRSTEFTASRRNWKALTTDSVSRTTDTPSRGYRFDSRLLVYCVTTLGKLLVQTFTCVERVWSENCAATWWNCSSKFQRQVRDFRPWRARIVSPSDCDSDRQPEMAMWPPKPEIVISLELWQIGWQFQRKYGVFDHAQREETDPAWAIATTTDNRKQQY